MSSSKYVSLTREQKHFIRSEYLRSKDYRKNTTALALAVWGKEEFKFPVPPGATTVKCILCEKETGSTHEGYVFKPTCVRDGSNPELERRLYNWLCYQNNKRLNINGNIIKAQAIKMQKKLQRSPRRSPKMHISFLWWLACKVQTKVRFKNLLVEWRIFWCQW